ncbi:microsomal glutathione S-transferase 2 isoform X2 [Dicentrarchus labrax]|uniref:Microsomal glutathione S-transferase 2 n=1 Tax=Dicentrarchus labrax TaxID=13489 RepID=A0A8P4GRD7_DICLA|nr:microsomal glutathione S-transferase 2 isoform X2 [Dicentrarchus labrax]
MGTDSPFLLAAVSLLSALHMGEPKMSAYLFSSGSSGYLPSTFLTPPYHSGSVSGYLARRVGWSRMAHKVLPPSVTGPPQFERTFRAHQNCVECYPVFLVTLWTCGMFFSELTAAAVGLVYIIARQIYFNGYVKSTKKRLPGFYLTLAVFVTLSLLGLIGILRGILHKYLHIHL